jgi:hypothetical protein
MTHPADKAYNEWSKATPMATLMAAAEDANLMPMCFRAGWDAAVKAMRPKTTPSVGEVAEYMKTLPGTSRDVLLTAQDFVDYYESCGWKIGSKPMKSWTAAARRWVRNQSDYARPGQQQRTFKEIPACN